MAERLSRERLALNPIVRELWRIADNAKLSKYGDPNLDKLSEEVQGEKGKRSLYQSLQTGGHTTAETLARTARWAHESPLRLFRAAGWITDEEIAADGWIPRDPARLSTAEAVTAELSDAAAERAARQALVEQMMAETGATEQDVRNVVQMLEEIKRAGPIRGENGAMRRDDSSAAARAQEEQESSR